MFPHINTNLSPVTFSQSGEYRNGSPRNNSRRLVSLNNLSPTKFNCNCGSEFGEPCVCGPNIKNLTPSNSLSRIHSGCINPFPDLNPDPSLFRFVSIESEAFKLALHTLRISESEFNGMTIEDLRRFPNTIPESYAINILIEYKKKSGITISPIKKGSPLSHEIKFNQTLPPQTDELDNFVLNSARDLRQTRK